MYSMTKSTTPSLTTHQTQCWRGFEYKSTTRRQTPYRGDGKRKEKEKEEKVERESFFFLYTAPSLGINRRQQGVVDLSSICTGARQS